MRRHVHAVELPLPPERAFALLVEPSAIRAWWGAARAIVAPEVGGDWVAAWGADEDAPDYVVAATLDMFDPPRRLRLADFRYVSKDGALPFDGRSLTSEFTVEPRDGGAELRVVQDGFPDGGAADAFFDACHEGWRQTFEGVLRFATGEVERAREPRGEVPLVPRLLTERLVLRAFRPSDVGAYAHICADPEVMRHLGGRVWSRTESWRHMATMLGHWTLRGYGSWAVERREDGAFLGRVGCIEPDGWPGFEVGWTLGREHWGHGYATEAATAALRWARDVLGKDRVVHLIADDNERSAAVARRLGALPGGRTRVMDVDVVVWESSGGGAPR